MVDNQQVMEAIKEQTRLLREIKSTLTNVSDRLTRAETRIVKLMIHEGLEGFQAYDGKKSTFRKTKSQ